MSAGVGKRRAATGASGGAESGVQPQVNGQQSYDLLQMKYLTADRNYETLKQLTRKGNMISDQAS